MIKATCPKCKKWAEGYDVVNIIFGFRRTKKRVIPQSWCNECRINKEETRKKIYKRYEESVIDLWDDLKEDDLEKKPVSIKKMIKIDLLDGLTYEQVAIIKRLVRKGLSPMGFSVDVGEDKIYYMGKKLLI